jgi:hypothetical protein
MDRWVALHPLCIAMTSTPTSEQPITFVIPGDDVVVLLEMINPYIY